VNRRFALSCVLTLLSLCTTLLQAQSSSLQGVVTDAQGAAVPGAVINLLNEETSASRSTVASQTGSYSFPQIPPGQYKLEVTAPGFRVFASRVRLQINSPATLDAKLEIGQVTETVNVSGEVSAVNTQNASVGSPFTEVQVRQLPLQTRNVVELLALQPGVTSTGQVIGAKADQNNVTLDGIDVNDSQGTNGFNAVLPIPLDSVQEFRRWPGRVRIRAVPREGRYRSPPKAVPTPSMDRSMSSIATSRRRPTTGSRTAPESRART